jgi:hypothetical protein
VARIGEKEELENLKERDNLQDLCTDGTQLALDRDKWRAVMNTIMKL